MESIDVSELGLYLTLTKPKEELERLGLIDYCPQRKSNRGAPPKLTGCAMDSRPEKRFAPWNPPKLTPDENVKKRMLAEGLRSTVLYIMKNHIYSFDGTTRKQAAGGPIGLDLTGDLAGIFMSWWDKEMIKRLTECGFEVLLYKRYVDDINIVARAPDGNQGYIRDRQEVMVIGEGEEIDAHALELMKTIGNDIHPSIQLETDYPSRHEDKKLPLLDLKFWTVKSEDNQYSKIMHEFYYKDVSTRSVVHARSSLPWNTKRTVLTQEILRILLRCSPELPFETVKGHVETFILRMQYSGYNESFRSEVVRSAFAAHKKIVLKDKQGQQPLYRPKEWMKKERQNERRRRKGAWYKKGGNLSVIFVPATPRSELKKRYEEVVKQSDIGIRIVERSGRTLKSLVQKSDPFDDGICSDKERCMVCRNGSRKGGRCRQECIEYEIRCEKCGDVYEGESSRNAYTRGCEHQAAYEKREKDSIMWRHAST